MNTESRKLMVALALAFVIMSLPACGPVLSKIFSYQAAKLLISMP